MASQDQSANALQRDKADGSGKQGADQDAATQGQNASGMVGGQLDSMSGQRFNAASASIVNTTNDTIDLGADAYANYHDGDAVQYLKGASGNTAVGGLTSGATYYVHKETDGSVSFYDNHDHAVAGGATGRVDITGTGSGSDQSILFGKQKSDQRIAGISAAGAGSLSGSSPKASDVSSKLASTALGTNVFHGTAATVAANTAIHSGSLQVKANENLHLDSLTGAVGVGAVGVGVGVSVVTVQSNVAATAGGTITAGGPVLLDSQLYENVNLISAAGGGGAVGVGASVAVITDSSTNQARLGDHASVNASSALSVLATTTQDIALAVSALFTVTGVVSDIVSAAPLAAQVTFVPSETVAARLLAAGRTR